MSMRTRFVIVYVLLAGVAALMHFRKDLEVPLVRPFGEFPLAHNGWRMVDQSTLPKSIINVLMPTDYLSRRYAAKDGAIVDMYLSFFNGGPESGRIHSPKNCVVGAGWTELLSKRITMSLGGESVNLVQAVYAKGERRDVIYYWFVMRGNSMSDEYSLKISEIIGSIFHRRRDQSFIRISVETMGNTDVAQKKIEGFLHDFYPEILKFLPS